MNNRCLFHKSSCVVNAVGVLFSLGLFSRAEVSLALPQHPDKESVILQRQWQAYNPPSNARISGNGTYTNAGSRGCGDDLIALAPRLSVGQTISTRPVFLWYVWGDGGAPLEVELYRFPTDATSEPEFISVVPIGLSRSGIMAYELAPDQPDLEVGELYAWQVTAYCDENLERIGGFTFASIDVVEPAADLPAVLPENALDRAQVYARYGLWYDAIAAVHDPATPEERAYRESLLQDLAELEDQPQERRFVNPGAQLRAILEAGQ